MILARHLIAAGACLIGLLCPVAPLAAQSSEFGDCRIGDAEAFLDVGNVRAKIVNTGGLFWNGGANVYEVPKGSGNHSIFASNLMIGGLLEGELRVSASHYGPFEMWPGPVPPDASLPTDCETFDRIYGVRFDGAWTYEGVEGIVGDIADWPVELGAPFIDVDGDLSRYNPDAGDRPAMIGDQMLWWIMNDRGNEHRNTESLPIGVEIRASAFAYRDIGTIGEQTFYKYRIRNRNEAPLRGVYIGLHNDWDLGSAFDDYVGSDSLLGFGYAYNADNDDDGNYGESPPAIGVTVLQRPESTIDAGSPECRYEDGKAQGLTTHINYRGGGGIWGDAQTGEEYYNYMQARVQNGTHLHIGGIPDVHELGPVGAETNFVFPGNPVTGEYWSEMNVDDAGNPNESADRKSYAAVGPFCLGPGDETEVVFAYVWARGDDNLDSVRRLRAEARHLQESADELLKPRRIGLTPPVEPELPGPFAASIFPNPAGERATLRVGLPKPMDVRVEVFDALGRRVTSVVDARLEAGDRSWTIHTADWLPGVYLVRMQLHDITETRRLVVVR